MPLEEMPAAIASTVMLPERLFVHPGPLASLADGKQFLSAQRQCTFAPELVLLPSFGKRQGVCDETGTLEPEIVRRAHWTKAVLERRPDGLRHRP
jgi:hypothetical protein